MEPILKAAQHWKDVGLLSDGSVFDRGAIWTLSNLGALGQHFVNHPDKRKEDLVEKLRDHLDPTAPGVTQLAAEMLWLMFLCPLNIITQQDQRKDIKRIWEWSGDAFPEDSEWVGDDVLIGAGNPGRSFFQYLRLDLVFFIRVVVAFKGLTNQERNRLLSDGWEFARWLEEVPECDKRQLRHMLLFLLFPDDFERTFGGRVRKRIVYALTEKPEIKSQIKKLSALEIDRELLDIRKRLELEQKGEIDFHVPPLLYRWSAPKDREVVEEAKQPDDQERSETKGRGCRNQILYGPSGTGKTHKLRELLKKEYSSSKSILSRKTWLAQELRDATWFEVIFGALFDLGGKSDVKEIRAHEYVQVKAKALGLDPSRAPIWGNLQTHTSEGSSTVRTQNRIAPFPFDKGPNSVWFFAEDWEEECAEQVEQAKKWKAGPGGSSEERPLERHEFVAFHQAYSYEDFVEGIRPDLAQEQETGEIGYRVEDGAFKRICHKAKDDPDQQYAIFIDEINRGNIAKIFGELITLVEEDKRATYNDTGDLRSGMELTLPYSRKKFSVPRNLDIYGTMNTADRSVALLDTALRRRFEFEELMPDASVINGSRGDGYIEDGDGGSISLRKLLEAMNRRIRFLLNRDMMLGHAYFFDVRDFSGLKRVLFNKIIPLLQEYFYEDWHKIQLVFRDVGPAGKKLEPQIVCHKTLNEKETLGFDHDHFEDSTEYWIVAPKEITPAAVRKVYEESD